MSMTFQVLKSQADLELFARRSCELVGNHVPVEYFKLGRVVGAFINQEMVGGWALAYPAFGRLRCMAAMPLAEPAHRPMKELIEQGQLCEFTQVWLDPKGATARQSVRFWMRLSADIVANAKTYIIFGFNSENQGLLKLYSRLHPRLIYQGPLAHDSHLQSHSDVTIMLLQRSQFRFIFWRNMNEMIRRLFRKQRGIQKLTHQTVVMNSATLKLRKLG